MGDLKLLAEKATQGRWTAYIGASNTNEVQLNHDSRRSIVSWPGFDGLSMSKEQVKANARYIAAANPKVIIDLINRLDEMEAGIKVIAPWLSASLTKHEHDGAGDYLKACNEIFRLDQNG